MDNSKYIARTELVTSGYWFDQKGGPFPGSTVIILRADETLPHVRVSWYIAGMGESGVCAVRPGESHTEAAERAFGPASRSNRKISAVTWV